MMLEHVKTEENISLYEKSDLLKEVLSFTRTLDYLPIRLYSDGKSTKTVKDWVKSSKRKDTLVFCSQFVGDVFIVDRRFSKVVYKLGESITESGVSFEAYNKSNRLGGVYYDTYSEIKDRIISTKITTEGDGGNELRLRDFTQHVCDGDAD